MANTNKRSGKHATLVVRSSSKDQSRLRDRLTNLWGDRERRQQLESQGLVFQPIAEDSSPEAILDSRTGPADAFLEYDPSQYRLLKTMVTQGATVVSLGDDGKALPPADRLVLVTRSIGVLEEGETKLYSEVFVLERKE
jgi:hypothetical protein